MNAAEIARAQRAAAFQGISAAIRECQQLANDLEAMQLRSPAGLVLAAVDSLEWAYKDTRSIFQETDEQAEIAGGPIAIASRRAPAEPVYRRCRLQLSATCSGEAGTGDIYCEDCRAGLDAGAFDLPGKPGDAA